MLYRSRLRSGRRRGVSIDAILHPEGRHRIREKIWRMRTNSYLKMLFNIHIVREPENSCTKVTPTAWQRLRNDSQDTPLCWRKYGLEGGAGRNQARQL